MLVLTGVVGAYGELLGRPGVEVDRLDARDVHAEVAVNAGAADAQEHAQIPRAPARTCVRVEWISGG